MRDVTIHLEKKEFFAGDEVAGHIVVTTDSAFSCNRIILKIEGKEYTHYQAGKVHVSDTHKLLDDILTIWEGGDIQSGDSTFEFSFQLPEELSPVYDGLYGSIDYSIEAVVEVDRALDPKVKVPLDVKVRPPEFIPDSMGQSMSEEKEHISAEIPTDIVRPGKGLTVKYIVKERSRVKGIRIDTVRLEEATCQGRELTSKTELNEHRFPVSFNSFDRWFEESILEDWMVHAPFEGKLIKSSLHIKVVLEIGLSLDPEIWFPLRLSGEGKEEEDLFDAFEMDLGWE